MFPRYILSFFFFPYLVIICEVYNGLVYGIRRTPSFQLVRVDNNATSITVVSAITTGEIFFFNLKVAIYGEVLLKLVFFTFQVGTYFHKMREYKLVSVLLTNYCNYFSTSPMIRPTLSGCVHMISRFIFNDPVVDKIEQLTFHVSVKYYFCVLRI